MDYKLVSRGAKEVIGSYLRSPEGYEQGLKTFYTEGVKNPSVARILFHDEVIKNSRECVKIQQRLKQEFDEFKPSEERIKPSDFKPKGFLAEMIADSAAKLLNTVRDGYEVLSFYQDKLFEMEVNKMRLMHPISILENFNAPGNIKNEKAAFDNAFDAMYPKTGEIRKKLIKYNIRAGRVTSRLPEKEKLFIREPLNELFESDPQAASARLDEIEGKEAEKTSFITKVKNLIKSKEVLEKEKQLRLEERKKEYKYAQTRRALMT